MGSFKEGIPVKYDLDNERNWASYFWDLLRNASGGKKNELWTPFADPRQQQIARELLHHAPDVRCYFWGGYPEAERVRLCAAPASLPVRYREGPVACLAVEGNFPPGVLSQRDFLGAILGLGIKREMVGDILYYGEEKGHVFVSRELLSFIQQNLVKIGRFNVRTEEIDLQKGDFQFKPQRVKEIKGTVASMRLDTVAGLGFGLSRSRIMPLIKGEQVKVNYQVVKQPSKIVHVGDIISLSGKGRIEVIDSPGETRKGRLHVLLHRLV